MKLALVVGTIYWSVRILPRHAVVAIIPKAQSGQTQGKLSAVLPNPSLSPRPATAGRLARAAPWFILHRTGKPSCLRGRG